MYLLDTNVISELRKAKSGKANSNVTAWAEQISPSNLFLSVMTLLELEVGILSVERRDAAQGLMLRTWLESQVLPAFSNRILLIDIEVVQCCAKLHVPDRLSERDAIIAATALVHRMIVVTRNTQDFEKTGIEIINPWEPINLLCT